MTRLSDQQKQLLFDYCLGLTSEVENAQAQELIFSNDEASRLVALIKGSLSPLDAISPEQCPDELAEGTIWRAQQAVRTSRLQLTELISSEQNRKTVKVGFWHEILGRLVAAAIFIVVGTGLITGGKMATSYARQKSWQQQCGSQLAGLFGGLSNYKADNGDQMPALASAPGSPWWKVGDQGPENVSNTRKMWILVKQGYVKPDAFMCPSKQKECGFSCEPKDYNDFPSRKLVTYSFRIGSHGSAGAAKQIVISDMNPIFEALPSPSDGTLIVKLSDALLKLNSPNHSGRGQNVLFCDGSVKFLKTRKVDVSLDDIYTIQNTSTYQGIETPVSEADAFLAP